MENALLQEKVLLGAKFRPRPKTARERAVDRWFTKRKPHLTLGCASDLVLHTDHLGTPQKLTDSNQTVVWDATYDPFGTANIVTETVTNNIRFLGQYFDDETGLHYNINRYYDPTLDRYITSDPIGVDGGINTYIYALANPIRYVDPLGLWVRRCSRKLGDREGPNVDPNFPLRHDYLVVSGSILSFQAGSNMIWSQGYVDRRGEEADRACPSVCDDDKFDKYVFEAAKEIGEPTYCVIAYPGTIQHIMGARNCQTWADDVLNLAKEKYLENEDCPDCFK